MSKQELIDREILKEVKKAEKQYLLHLLRNIDVSEIVNFEYKKNVGLRDKDNWEKIVIIRKPKKLNLRVKE